MKAEIVKSQASIREAIDNAQKIGPVKKLILYGHANEHGHISLSPTEELTPQFEADTFVTLKPGIEIYLINCCRKENHLLRQLAIKVQAYVWGIQHSDLESYKFFFLKKENEELIFRALDQSDQKQIAVGFNPQGEEIPLDLTPKEILELAEAQEYPYAIHQSTKLSADQKKQKLQSLAEQCIQAKAGTGLSELAGYLSDDRMLQLAAEFGASQTKAKLLKKKYDQEIRVDARNKILETIIQDPSALRWALYYLNKKPYWLPLDDLLKAAVRLGNKQAQASLLKASFYHLSRSAFYLAAPIAHQITEDPEVLKYTKTLIHKNEDLFFTSLYLSHLTKPIRNKTPLTADQLAVIHQKFEDIMIPLKEKGEKDAKTAELVGDMYAELLGNYVKANEWHEISKRLTPQ